MANSSFKKSTSITIPVTVPNGGTGRISLTDKNVILGAGTGSVNFSAPGASGNALVSDGINWTSGLVGLSDGTVTYPKLATDLVSKGVISAVDIDWSAGSIFTKTLSANTIFTFSNYQLNKTITLIIQGNYALGFPTTVKNISGTYNGLATNYITLTCSKSTAPQEVLIAISQYSLPFDSYTKLLLHCDGSDTSTTFTDECGNTFTANGNVQIDTAQKKFGTGSALFDGTTDYLSTALGSNYNFGSGDFTIEGWVRPSHLNGDSTPQILFHFYQDANNQIYAYLGTSGNDNRLVFRAYSGGVEQCLYVENAVPTVLTVNTWAHLAFVRYGNTFNIYVNGTAIAFAGGGLNISISGKTLPTFSSGNLYIGSFNDGSDAYYGHVDEIRISTGIARWTSNFTPPTSEY